MNKSHGSLDDERCNMVFKAFIKILIIVASVAAVFIFIGWCCWTSLNQTL